MDDQKNIPMQPEKDEYRAEDLIPDEELFGDLLKEKPQSEQEESQSEQTQEPMKKKSKKHKKAKGCLFTSLWMFCIVAVSVALASFAVVSFSDYMGLGKDFIRMQETKVVHIDVEEGASVRQIATQLKEKDVIMSRFVFLVYVKLTDQGGDFSYGAHDFDTAMGYRAILSSLAQPAKGEDVMVTIPSGKTTEEILHILDDAGVCTYADLRQEVLNGTFESELWEAIPEHSAMYYPLEGYLFPDTYSFYLNDDPHRVIQKMLDNLEEKFTPAMRQAAKDKGMTTHEILTMASIIELESCGYYDEMPKVSAVFYNRLTHWPKGLRRLQSDPTMYYPYGDGAYNTYKIEGLPPGPMSSVTETAIYSAIYPDITEEATYFVTDKNGVFYYSTNLSDHEATITALKDRDLWLTTPYFE